MFGPTGQRERQLAQGYARLTGRDAPDASHPHFHRGNQRAHVQDVQGVGGQVQVRDDMAVAVKDKFNLAPSVPCVALPRASTAIPIRGTDEYSSDLDPVRLT